MKRKIVSIFVYLIALWSLTFFISKSFLPNSEAVTITVQEPLVYVTTYGEKYHSERCHYLKRSSHPIGKEKAKQQGYDACTYCDGYAYEYITEEYFEIKPINDTPKAIVIASIASPCFTLIIVVLLSIRAKKKASI